MKKVLIIGTDFFGYTDSVKRAFKKLGYDPSVIIYKPEVSSFKEKVEYHLSFNKINFRENILPSRFNQKVLDRIKSLKPDLVLFFQETPISKETVLQIKNCKTVIWMLDSIYRKKYMDAIKEEVDYLFLFEKTDIPKLSKTTQQKAFFLTCALDEQVYYPTKKQNEIDILFIGHIYENRMVLLQKMFERFKNYNIKIYGKIDLHVKEQYKAFLEEHKDVFLDKNITPNLANELYNKTKICLNIHYSQSLHGTNQRFFEVSGSKAFQVVDENEYIAQNFTSDEIMTYKTELEMFDNLSFALNNQATIDKMAERAYNKVINEHTFRHRVQFLLDNISK
jgi:spore maturation protein CgeB